MNYEPHCLMTWQTQVAAADDQLAARTVEQVIAELNQAKSVLAEIEADRAPMTELKQMRALTAEYVARRAILEAQSAMDARAVVERAEE